MTIQSAAAGGVWSVVSGGGNDLLFGFLGAAAQSYDGNAYNGDPRTQIHWRMPWSAPLSSSFVKTLLCTQTLEWEWPYDEGIPPSFSWYLEVTAEVQWGYLVLDMYHVYQLVQSGISTKTLRVYCW
jgi:hypothetical protein